MFNKLKLIIGIILFLSFFNLTIAKENFFNDAKNKFEKNKYEESKFLFQRNIVFNPKDAQSYLYLAKIYNSEKNEKEEEKNLRTALLLEPDNEEAMYMMINIELNKSNYSQVKSLIKDFTIICLKLCEKTTTINKDLKNIEPENKSKE